MKPLKATGYPHTPKFWTRVHDFAHRHKKALLVAAVITVGLAGGLVAFIWLNQKPTETSIVKQQSKEEPKPPEPVHYFSPLTGLEVPDEASTKAQVRAVMIENSPAARPQSGLKEAGVIFEAIAEGGITRFLCLYQEGRPGLIGPVRSLRPYYIDWLKPFDASVSHVGGSFNALREIRNGTYKDIDEFRYGSSQYYYWRTNDRTAPHNLYTSTIRLEELNQKLGYTSSTFKGFTRKAESPSPAPNATKIDIPISSATYNVHYDYDPATNSYIRSLGGQRHTDREVGQLQPKVVVVMEVFMEKGFEDGYREQMATLGNGRALIFQDGSVIEGTWNKPDKQTQITFIHPAGHEIQLNPGQTWISVIEPTKRVTWQ